MALFSKDELKVIDTLASGKRLSLEDKEGLDELKAKLGASAQSEIPERFVNLTGWSNSPKDYPQ